jgi:hypothetical protein
MLENIIFSNPVDDKAVISKDHVQHIEKIFYGKQGAVKKFFSFGSTG